MQGFTAVFTMLRLLTIGNVLCGDEEESGAVHQDRGRVTVDAKRGGAVGAAGCRRAYVLVNNRAEGNAPLTVQGLWGCCGARPGDYEAALGCLHIPGATRAPLAICQLWI